MRLDVAICEDNERDSEILAGMLNETCGELGYDVSADIFRTGEEFLAACESKAYHVSFMDIYLEGMSGIEAARSVGGRCRFVFTTTSTEHAVEAFAINAAHYLVKPLTKERVADAISRCVALISEKNASILSIRTGRRIVRIPMENIVYIEVKNKVCAVHTENGSYETQSSLNSLYGQLDEELFIRAQQSFAVNMDFIESFYYDRVIVCGGVEIALSRTNRAELKRQYQRFLFGQVRGESL